MSNKKSLKILVTSAEVAPFAKAGGLADVAGSLPPALKKIGCDVRIIMPLYGLIDHKKYGLKKIFSNIAIPTDGKTAKINIWQTELPGKKVQTYFVEYNKFFGKKNIYQGNSSERFLFFSLAALYVLPILKFQPDVIHCHDFHTALIPDLIKASEYTYFQNIKTLYTIHNLNYQGKSEVEVLSTGNLNKGSLHSLKKDASDGDINFMVQGIVGADAVNTVSPTYAKEIATSVYGAGLEKVVKNNSKKISGILNGIDTDFFDPSKDKLIKQKYSVKTLNKKSLNKLGLQKRLGLPQSKDVPLIGFVSRLAWQKGVELIAEAAEQLCAANQNCQFVFLGTGQKKYERQLKKLAKKFPKKISAQTTFNAELAQMIYAASDIFLMPSRFEPCGLGQMIAMRYGAVPVVRLTGGLKDTVNSKVGFGFKDFETKALFDALGKALRIYENQPQKFKQMQINGMKKDFTWDKSAKEYLKIYRKITKK